MDSINDIYLKAIEFFPRWMNIRRRPYKSSEGDLLSSIIEEYQDVRRAIEEYQKDFFLVNFFGREDEILETLYAAHIGAIEDFSEFKINDTLTVTTDIETFQQDTKTYYYQDGYLLVRPRFVKDDRPYLDYTYKGYPYSIRWIEMHVWNVYDEFAWFAGLSRFEKESNKELCTRTLAAFKNRTNVTEKGLRNAIVNIASDILSKATITFEQPTEKNMALPDDAFGTVFERLAQENKDLARTKIWDLTYWENRFKTMSYLPHIWDAAEYEKTGPIFVDYVTPQEQADALYLNLAILRKYNADYPYEVHEFSFSSNPDFYTEVLKALDNTDEFLWTEPKDLVKRVEDALFAAAYGSQEDFMQIYRLESKNSLKRKVLLDAAPLVAAVRIAAAYGRCPSYPIFEGISAIIDAFGLDSPYVLQRTCQYILDLGYPLIYENLKLARPTFDRIVEVAAEGPISSLGIETFHYLQELAEYKADEDEKDEEPEFLTMLEVKDFLSTAEDWMVDIKEYNPTYYRELMKKGEQEALMEVARILFFAHNKFLRMRTAMWEKLDREGMEQQKGMDFLTRVQLRTEIEMQCREMIQEELNHTFLYE